MKTAVEFTEEGKNFIAVKVLKGAEQFRLEEIYKDNFSVWKTIGHFSNKGNQVRFEYESPLSLYIVGFATDAQKETIKSKGILFSEQVSEVPDFASYQKFEDVYRKAVENAQTPEELTVANAALTKYLQDNAAIFTAQKNYQEAWEEAIIFELK